VSRPSHQVSGVLCWLAGGNGTPYGRIRLSDSRSRGRAAQSSPSRSTSFHLRSLLVFYACEFVPTHNTYFHVNKPFKPSPTPGPRRACARARPRWPHTPLTRRLLCIRAHAERCMRAPARARAGRALLSALTLSSLRDLCGRLSAVCASSLSCYGLTLCVCTLVDAPYCVILPGLRPG
jgi:hypothetical protein